MKKLLLIQLVFLTYSSLYGSRNSLLQELSILYPNCNINKIVLPLNYSTPEYHKIYFLFSTTSSEKEIRQLSGVMMQFYKKFAYDEPYLKRWPKDILFQIFDYLTLPLFIIDFEKVSNNIDANAIRNACIKEVLPPSFLSFDIVPSGTDVNNTEWLNNYLKNQSLPLIPSKVHCKDWIIRIEKSPDHPNKKITAGDIAQLKEVGLLPERNSIDISKQKTNNSNNLVDLTLDTISTYNAFKSFNNHKYALYIRNRTADEYLQINPLTGPYSHNLSHLLNMIMICCDRDGNNESYFEFKDYIRTAFITKNKRESHYLYVELIDESLQSYNNGELEHNPKASTPCNHRIEIYDLKTKKLMCKIFFPLVAPYQFNVLSYSFFYVDDSNLYLYDHKNEHHVKLPYEYFSATKLIGIDLNRLPSQGKIIKNSLIPFSVKPFLNELFKKNDSKHYIWVLFVLLFAILIQNYYTLSAN